MAKRAVHFLQPERRLADIKETEELPNERWLEESPEGNADDGREAMEKSNPFWKLRRTESGRTLDDLTEQEGKVKDKSMGRKRQLASDTAEGSGRDPMARIAALEGTEHICTADSQNMLRENHSDACAESQAETSILSQPTQATPTPAITVSSRFKDFLQLKAVECKRVRVYAICKGLSFQDHGFPAAAHPLPRRPWSAYGGTFQPRCVLVHSRHSNDSAQRKWLAKFGGEIRSDESKRFGRMERAKHPPNEYEELWLHNKRLQLMELHPLPFDGSIVLFSTAFLMAPFRAFDGTI